MSQEVLRSLFKQILQGMHVNVEICSQTEIQTCDVNFQENSKSIVNPRCWKCPSCRKVLLAEVELYRQMMSFILDFFFFFAGDQVCCCAACRRKDSGEDASCFEILMLFLMSFVNFAAFYCVHLLYN